MRDVKTISGACGSEQIIKKLLGEVEENFHPGEMDPFGILKPDLNFIEEYWSNSYNELEGFAKFVGCDIALELKGKKLWAWSIKVIGDTKIVPPLEDKGFTSPLSSPVMQGMRV